MNNEEWKQAEERLTSFFRTVELKIDGYKVSVCLEREGVYKNALMVYINGEFKGEWIINDCEERRRFYRPVTKHFHSKKTRAKLPKKRFPDVHKPYTYHLPCWGSFSKMKAHFIKHNEAIELANNPDHV